MWALCSQNGSPLPVGEQLRSLCELQILHTFPRLCGTVLFIRSSKHTQVFSAVLDIAHPLKPLTDDRFHGKNEFS